MSCVLLPSNMAVMSVIYDDVTLLVLLLKFHSQMFFFWIESMLLKFLFGVVGIFDLADVTSL